jgi:putative peptidoglycan lipid II flippase
MLTTIIGMLAAPYLIMAFAPGFSWEGEQYELAVQMLRITFPYLFLHRTGAQTTCPE